MPDAASGNRHRGFDILADAEHQRHDGERFMLGYAYGEVFASSETGIPPRLAAQVADRRDWEVVGLLGAGLRSQAWPFFLAGSRP